MTKLGYEKAFVKMDPRFSWPYFFTRFSDKSQKVLFLSSQAWYRPLLRRYCFSPSSDRLSSKIPIERKSALLEGGKNVMFTNTSEANSKL